MTFNSVLGNHRVIYVILKGRLLVISVPILMLVAGRAVLFVSKYFSWHVVISLSNLRRLEDQCQNPRRLRL